MTKFHTNHYVLLFLPTTFFWATVGCSQQMLESLQAVNGGQEIPPYPDAIRVDSLSISSIDSEVEAPPGVTMLVTPEPDVLKIAGWYESELLAAGWSIVEQNSDDGEYCLFRRSEEELSVSIGTFPEPKPDGHENAQSLIVIDSNKGLPREGPSQPAS